MSKKRLNLSQESHYYKRNSNMAPAQLKQLLKNFNCHACYDSDKISGKSMFLEVDR
jgi:hypothetical protein